MSDLTRKSKFCSLVLRHDPGKIGIILDQNGWTDVASFTRLAKITRTELNTIVETNNKQRFSFSEDGTKIRANQGHSVSVDLNLPESNPPDFLYHGTATRFLDSIFVQGLIPGTRHAVHLSADKETAMKVGSRHGNAIVLFVNAREMHKVGFKFYQSTNGVWLVENVPVKYLTKV